MPQINGIRSSLFYKGVGQMVKLCRKQFNSYTKIF